MLTGAYFNRNSCVMLELLNGQDFFLNIPNYSLFSFPTDTLQNICFPDAFGIYVASLEVQYPPSSSL